MAGILSKFINNSIGAAGRIVDYTAIINPSGDFNRIYELEVILNSWNNILLTPLRSADHDPTYGSNLYKYVFDPMDSKTQDKIISEVKYALNQDTRASIDSIKISPLKKGFRVDIYVNFQGAINLLQTKLDQSLYANALSK